MANGYATEARAQITPGVGFDDARAWLLQHGYEVIRWTKNDPRGWIGKQNDQKGRPMVIVAGQKQMTADSSSSGPVWVYLAFSSTPTANSASWAHGQPCAPCNRSRCQRHCPQRWPLKGCNSNLRAKPPVVDCSRLSLRINPPSRYSFFGRRTISLFVCGLAQEYPWELPVLR